MPNFEKRSSFLSPEKVPLSFSSACYKKIIEKYDFIDPCNKNNNNKKWAKKVPDLESTLLFEPGPKSMSVV